MGCRSRAGSVRPCHGVLALREGPLTGACAGEKPAARGRKQVGSSQCRKASKFEGLKLVSSQFRKQRLAIWAAGRGPDPSLPLCLGPARGSFDQGAV